MAVSGWVRRASLAVAAAAGLLAATLVAPTWAPAAAAAPAGQQLVHVGSVPALPPGAQASGTSPRPGTQLRLDVLLRSRDPAGLEAFGSAVSSPGSADYHHYLGPAAFLASYGPAPTAVAAVEDVLRAEGLSPGPLRGLAIPVSATVAQAAAAFRTPIRNYRLTGGRMVFANAAAPSVPASIATDLSAIVGLDDLSQSSPDPIVTPKPKLPPARTGSFVTAAGPQPCAAARVAASEYGTYTSNQLAGAYGFTGLYKAHDLGAGQTVALVETDSFSMRDLDTFASCFGISPAALNRQVRVVPVDGGSGAGPGALEAALDVEVVLSLAPAAHIEVYEGANNSVSGLDELDRIVSDDSSQVVSISAGICEDLARSGEPGLLEAEDAIFEQAAAQGQTVLAASGDNGSEACSATSPSLGSFASVSDPASQPFVTGVGGTDLTALGNPPSEIAWNQSGTQIGASGGGFSDVWSRPAWQQALVSEAPSVSVCGPAGGACRGVPDVSASADPTHGYTIYDNGAWLGIGGTSASTPLWAAAVALTNASAPCGGVPIGYLNPRLYQLGEAQYLHGGPRYFNDITSGDNDFTGLTNVYSAAPGWDPVTGLGSPVLTDGAGAGGGLAEGLCESVAAAWPSGSGPSVNDVSPPVGSDKGGTKVTITGAHLAGASAVSFGTVVVPATSIIADSASSITLSTPPAFVGPATGQSEDGTVRVMVSTPAGTSAPSPKAAFTYQAAAPELAYMTIAGPTGGGTPVYLSGSGFSRATKVGFGRDVLGRQDGSGRSCKPSESGFCVLDDNTISLVAPPASRALADPGAGGGAVAVVISAPGGTTASGPAITPNQEFYFAPPPGVSSVAPGGPPAGGYQVTVHGSGFAAYCGFANPEPALDLCADAPYGAALVSGIEVVVAGHAAQIAGNEVKVISDSTLSFTMPAEPGNPPSTQAAKVEVATLGGSASASYHYQRSGPAPPTLASVSPDIGTTHGETPVHITGTHFQPGMVVSFGGIPSADILSINPAGTAATVLSPAGPAGVAPVAVGTPWGTTANSDSAVGPNQFTYVVTSPAVPTVLEVSSDLGPAGGAERVSITGSGFFANGPASAVSSIRFGGVAASQFSCVLDTACEASVPPHPPGTVVVTVTVGAGASAVTSPTSGGYDRFTYAKGPGITAISPSRGPAAGGTLVTITGFGFSPGSKVDFGGRPGLSVRCPSDTTCSAVTPGAVPGNVAVVVIAASGASPAGDGAGANRYTYLPPTVTDVAPDQGPTTGGTEVVVTGFGFTGASGISFGKLAATSFHCSSDTACIAVSPADPSAPTDKAGQVDVTVTVRGVKSLATGSDTFTYVVLR